MYSVVLGIYKLRHCIDISMCVMSSNIVFYKQLLHHKQLLIMQEKRISHLVMVMKGEKRKRRAYQSINYRFCHNLF